MITTENKKEGKQVHRIHRGDIESVALRFAQRQCVATLTALLIIATCASHAQDVDVLPTESWTWRIPVVGSADPAAVVSALKTAGTQNEILFVGESPFYKMVQALSGQRYRYVNFLSFNNVEASTALLEQSDRFAAYLPIRIALVEDRQGQLWFHTMNWGAVSQASEFASPQARRILLTLQDQVRRVIDYAANER